jgi:hypothetical protein
MTSWGQELQQQPFIILAQERPMPSFILCNILPLKLQIDQRAGRAPEPVWTQWRENASLLPLGIEHRIPNSPACCVVTLLRYPLRRSTCQADFSSWRPDLLTVRVGFAVEKSPNETRYSLRYFVPRQLSFHKSFSVIHLSPDERKSGLPYSTVLQRKENKTCGHKMCDRTLKHALVILARAFLRKCSNRAGRGQHCRRFPWNKT